jgi:hypothetical protein
MSLGSDLRNTGLGVLLDVDSETLSFRGEDVSVILNRPMPAGQGFDQVALNLLGGSSVEFLKEDLPAPSDGGPRLGEVFTETNGNTHRITRIDSTDLTWKLTCEPVDA